MTKTSSYAVDYSAVHQPAPVPRLPTLMMVSSQNPATFRRDKPKELLRSNPNGKVHLLGYSV